MFGILGLVAIVVFTIQVFKAARSTERNAGLWALFCAIVGIGFQLVLPLLVGVVLGVYYVLSGVPAEYIQAEIQGPAQIIGIVGLILSIVGMVLIAKHVSKVKADDPAAQAPPPPPPTFSQSN